MTAITGKQPAFGALLKVDALAGDSPGTYRNLAYVRSIKGPGLKVDTVDVTSHDSASAYEELVPTILRTGEITVEIVYDPADVTIKYSQGLLGKMYAKTLTAFKIVFYNDTTEGSRTTWTFNAYITGFTPTADATKELSATLTLKITGAPTIA